MLIDTFAWIELFTETQKGKKVKQLIANTPCYTSGITIAELSSWCMRENLDFGHYLQFVKSLSIILLPDEDIFEFAGKLNVVRKKIDKSWGMCDSIILATAQINKLGVVTGDRHFEDLKDAVML